MKFTQSILATALLAGAGVAQAELSANIGAASNYYFRGITQTGNEAAVSGGIDYAQESGFYAGTWMSNVNFGSSAPKANAEVDLYSGFGGDIGDTGLSYDLSAWYYWYPGAGGDAQGGNLDYAEASGSLGYGPVTGNIAYTLWNEGGDVNGTAVPFKEGDIWYSLAFEPDWNFEGFAPSASIGYYDFDQDGVGNQDLNYTSWTVGVSKDAGDFGAFSMNYVQNNYDGNADAFWGSDSPGFWVGWSKGF